MFTSKFKLYLPLIIILCIVYSCSSDVYKTVYPTLVDGKYDSEFPYSSSSKQLEEISNCVKLLNTLAFYSSYIFPSDSKLKLKDLSEDLIEKKANSKIYFNHTASGTATVIYARDRTVGLLTCAHIIDFADTVITYFKTSSGGNTEYVQSISFKERQSIYVTDLPEFGEVEIILINRAQDIALVGRNFLNAYASTIPTFDYPIGEARELDWGSFVYVFGYPMNYKMVTKGIVSSPNKNGKGSFLIDAVFNRGFSGGIVLAIRDGVPHFELVGLVRAVPGEYEYILKPSHSNEQIEYNPSIPYKGDIYVDQKVSLRYGITRAIAIEEVIEYLNDNKDFLIQEGYYLDNFFNK